LGIVSFLLCLLPLASCMPAVTDTPALPSKKPASYATSAAPTPFPYTPVPFEPLPPYPTPEGSNPGRGLYPAQELPPGATPAVPAPEPGVATGDGPTYYLVGQGQIGGYTIRLWENPLQGSRIVVISAGGTALVQVEAWRMEVRHAGQDITGEGNPDVVVQLSPPGGSYHTLSTQVFDLGPTLTKVMDAPWVSSDPYPSVPCPQLGIFSDLDGDGSAEFVTCDDAPRWGFYGRSTTNPYAEHRRLMVMAILEYEPGQGYGPAGDRFASWYAPQIAGYTREAEEREPSSPAEEDGATLHALVSLAFYYLYSGQPQKAWAEIERLHRGADKVLLWSQILQKAEESPFYARAGTFPDLPVPDYYTLQLCPDRESDVDCLATPGIGRPTCEPVEWLAARFLDMYLPVCILEKGQHRGEEGVATRSLAWLDYELGRAGVVERGETLQVSSLGCGDRCRLNLVGGSGEERDTPLGFIELDSTGDLPGEIVRLDSQGSEVSRWRLRGDLTWEEVAP